MNKEQFLQIINDEDLKYENRKLLVNALLANREWVVLCIDLMQQVDNKQSGVAVRTLEMASKLQLNILLPHLDRFCSLLPTLKIEAVIRSSAKMIELLTVEHTIKMHPDFIQYLKEKHFEQIIETCFDWMLAGKAIAIQVHSMYALYLLGMKYDWIHAELIQIIERNLPHGNMGQSQGYKNRGIKILKAINSNKVLRL